MRKRYGQVLLLGSFFLFLPTGVFSEERLVGEAVKVSATRVERELLEVPVSVGVVDAADISSSGAGTVAEALRDIPGLMVHDGAVPGAKRVNIRGESGARVLVLIDGQKSSEQKAMTGAAFLTDPAMIERIEVIKGPGSVLYGSEAIGGVVNIITKKGGDKPISLTASAGYDSSTRGHREYLSVFGGLNGFSYRVSATNSEHGKRDAAGLGRLDNTEYKERSLSAYLEKSWDMLSVGMRAEKYDGDYSVYTPDGTISSGPYGMKHFWQSLPEWSREKYSLFFELRQPWQNLVKLSGNAYSQKVKKDFLMDMDIHTPQFVPFPPPPGLQTRVTQMRNRTVNNQQTYGLLLQSDWLFFDSHYFIAGLDYGFDKLTADEFRNTRSRVGNGAFSPFAPTHYIDQAESKVYALYAQNEWSMPHDLVFTIGARQTWIDAGLKSSTNPGLTPQSSRESKMVGAAGLNWSGINNTVIRANFSQGFRFGTLQQLYMGTVHGAANPTFPNPELKPESSNSYELGLAYRGKSLAFDGVVFLSEAKDYITTVDVQGGQRFSNVDKASSRGLEASISYQLGGFTPYASGQYLYRKFEKPGFVTAKTGFPGLEGVLGLRFDHQLDQDLRWYVDFFVNMASRAERENDDLSIDSYGAYNIANLRAGLSFGRKNSYSLNLNIRNLGDRAYKSFQESVPNPARHAYLSFEATF